MADRGPISDKELSAMIGREIRQSGNWTGSEWRQAIRQALDYFLLRNKGDEIPGRNNIQAGDIADIIDSVHADLQPMYNVDQLCEIGQEGPGDEEDSASETEAINWYWKERLRGPEVLDLSIQDALLARNGYMKVFYQKSKGLPYMQEMEGYSDQLEAELSSLAEKNEVEIVSYETVQEAQYIEVGVTSSDVFLNTEDRPLTQERLEVSPEYGRVSVKIIPIQEEVLLDSVAPEDMFASRDATDSNMQIMRFVTQRRRMPRQDVKALNFYAPDVDKMQNLNDWDEDVKTARQSDNNVYLRDASSHDGKQVDLFESYFKVDRDGDGVAEMLKIFSSATGEILHWDDNGEEGELAIEMVRVRPFACGSPLKLAHRHEGRSLFDKKKQIEDAKRWMIRQMLDNLAEANNTQTVFARNVNPEDIEETEIGRNIIADNPAQDVVPLKHNNIVNDSLQGLGYMDKMRRDRSGTDVGGGGREQMPVQMAAHSTERIMSALETAVAMYGRNFANTVIRDTFVLLHEQMKLLPGKITYQSGNKWAETEPRFWVQRNRISVCLGKTAGEKMREQAAYREAIEIQRTDAEGGMGILVDYNEMYKTRLRWAASAGLSDVQELWRDPNSPEAEQQKQQDAESAQQQQQLAQQQAAMLYQTQLQMTQMQEQTKRISDERDAMTKERDRLARMMAEMEKIQQKYVELEMEYGQDIPGEGIEGGEVIRIGQST